MTPARRTRADTPDENGVHNSPGEQYIYYDPFPL